MHTPLKKSTARTLMDPSTSTSHNHPHTCSLRNVAKTAGGYDTEAVQDFRPLIA